MLKHTSVFSVSVNPSPPSRPTAARRWTSRIRFPISISISLVAVISVCAQSSNADIVLEHSGGVAITLSQPKSWTIGHFSYDGNVLMSNPGSGQGTVIREDGEWAGSVHGNETVLDTTLLVDGIETALHDGETYKGDSLIFMRQTQLGDTFTLLSTIEIGSSGYSETVTLTRTSVPENVSIVYGFLGTRRNSLTEYASFNAEGSVLSEGSSDGDANAQINLPAAVAVAQYDPDLGIGLVTTVKEGSDLGLAMFIWDRPDDNKLYSRFSGLNGTLGGGQIYQLGQQVEVFNADPSSWVSTASILIPEPCTVLLISGGALTMLRKRVRGIGRTR